MIERDVTPSVEGQFPRIAEPLSDGPRTAGLPSHLRLLCVGAREPSWINLTLQLDAQGCTEMHLNWVSTAAEALAILRESSFDCILMSQPSPEAAELRELDPLHLLRAIRASGCEDPVIIVASRADDAMWMAACEEEGELLVVVRELESRALVSMIKRAVQRLELTRDNRRLALADRRRMSRERDEAEHLLNQQRQIVQGLELLSPQFGGDLPAPSDDASLSRPFTPEPVTRIELPARVSEYYQELLRTYVIMGSGNLGNEIAKLAELLCFAELSPRQALELHLERVEHLVRGLGNRSTRHVMARADLLALELMIHLGECYQRKATGQSAIRLGISDEEPRPQRDAA